MIGLLSPRLLPLERSIVYTPLGIRFWDAARDEAVVSGLVVRAFPRVGTSVARTATTTRSGVYAFFNLPGLRAVEYPYPPTRNSPVASPPATRRYVVQVVDAQRRFVPVAFEVDAPFEGIFPIGPAPASPGDGAPGFYLFSSPTRPAVAQAVVRATLTRRDDGSPAAHAVLELTLPGGRRVFGLADASGQVAAIFPYPRFESAVSSPPQSTEAARQLQDWPLTVRVRFAPDSQVSLLPSLAPDLRSLFSQPFADVWAGASGPPNTELGASLVFGRELVLRTDEGSTLLVG